MRAIDPDFEGDLLYRGLRADAIDDDGVTLRSIAVTFPSCSFDRRRYQGNGQPTLDRRHPRTGERQFVAVAAVEPELVEAPVSERLRWVLRDDPDPMTGNEAHCQADAALDGAPLTARMPGFSANEKRAKVALVKRLRLLDPATETTR